MKIFKKWFSARVGRKLTICCTGRKQVRTVPVPRDYVCSLEMASLRPYIDTKAFNTRRNLSLL